MTHHHSNVILSLLMAIFCTASSLKCMRPSDARFITPKYDIPASWINVGWHTGPYLSTSQNAAHPADGREGSIERGAIFSSNGTRMWWMENRRNQNYFLIAEDQSKLLCTHMTGGLRIDWFDNTEANRVEDWCQWHVETNPDDVTAFRMKSYVLMERIPEVGYAYIAKTGIYFDYDENSRNYAGYEIDDARKWFKWEKSSNDQRNFSLIEEECTEGTPDFLEPTGDVIGARSASGRRATTYLASSNRLATCSTGWYLHNEKCYKIFRGIVMSQTRGKRICTFLGGNLVVPKSQAEQSYLVRFLRRLDPIGTYWMGMERGNSGRRFFDQDGKPLIFRRWAKNRSTFASDMCSYWNNRRWYTASCSAQHKLMCTKEAKLKLSRTCGKIQKRHVDNVMRNAAEREGKVHRIIDGIPALEGQFPWQASLRFKQPVTFDGVEVIHNCGGTLIDECWVVTAAHCVPERDSSIFTVRLGDLNNELDDGTEQEFDIQRIFVHEEYTMYPSPRFDIALLRLQKKNGKCVRFNNVVQPACLPETSTFPIEEEGERCQVSGWGVTNTSLGQSSSATNLQWVTLPKFGDSYCRQKYNRRTEYFLDTIMICAGLKRGGMDACTGDSGGPYVCRNREGRYALVGVVSFGIGCARSAYPGVYTNVVHFIPWISAKISANGGGSVVA